MSNISYVSPSPRVITIAGAGFSGTTVLASLIRELKAAPCPEPTTICIADPRDSFGPGLPYAPDCDALILNQPAYAMSPFADDPDHFIRWLEQKLPGQSHNDLANSFQPRPLYGEYLRDIFRDCVEAAKSPDLNLRIVTIPQAIQKVSVLQDHSLTLRADNVTFISDALIIADGHYRNGLYAQWQNQPGFFEGTFPLSSVEDHLSTSEEKDGVLIIGMGQDSLDHLARLDAIGYTGKITAVSRRGVQPWCFDPKLHHPERDIPPYALTVFSPANIRRTQAATFPEFKALWEEELKIAGTKGYGPGHVLGAYFRTQDFPDTPDFQSMLDYVRAFYGNPTSPQRFNLLQRYLANGQLELKEGCVGADDITATGTAFSVDGKTYSAIFNGAGCARTARAPDGQVYSPLVRNLDQSGLVAWSQSQPLHLKAGRQLSNAFIYYAGPGAHADKWGIESFRTSHAAIASECLADLNARNADRSTQVSETAYPLTTLNQKGAYTYV